MPVVRSDAPFFWPLRGSITLQNGSGSTTFTRSSAAWGFNELGKLYKVPSGAVRMRGYRPVINQYSGNTDNMSGLSTARITLIDSAMSDADGTTKAGRWRLDASAGEHYLRLQSSAYEGKYVNIAFKIKLTSYRYVALRIGSWYNFYDLQTQSWNGALQGSSRDAVVSGDWVLLEMTGGPIPSGSPVFSLLFTSAALESSWTPLGTEEVIVYQAMMSDVTGDTDKTFSDYVAGDTSYGAGATGIKYFATYKDGAAIPEANLLGARLNPNSVTNNLLYCRDLTQSQVWKVSGYGSNLISNGTFDTDVSGWGGTNTAAVTQASNQLSLQMIGSSDTAYTSITCVVGVSYVVKVSVASGAGSARFLIGTTAGGSQVALVGQSTSGAAQTFFAVFTATATTHYVSLTVNTTTTRLFDNISVYPAAITTALNQTGLDGQSNACSLLTATATDGTVMQTITAASAAACSGFYVKRSAGAGSIYFTRDGGSNWTDITNLINSSTFTLVKIENTSVLNPQVGFKIATSGDAIIVDAGINHLGTQISETPILTTSTAVTVNADVPTAPTSGNFSDTAGTILATVTRDDWTTGNGSAVGSATRGLYTSSANSGVQGLDGTNTVNGPLGTPSGTMRIGIRWSGSTMQAFSNGTFGPAGNYDGSFNLGAAMQLLAGVQGAIKDVAIWPSSLSDADMISASKGMTFDGVPASLSMSALDGLMTIGRTILGDAASLALTAPDGQITIGRTIDADPASLSLIAPDGLMTIGRIIEADAATLTIITPDGRVLLDDSPKSTVTIAAHL